MRPMRYVVAAAVLGLLGHSAFAFEETTVGAGQPKGKPAAPVLELPKDLPKELPKTPEAAKGLSLTTPEFQLTTPGTEVRIPGIGKVGVLPKLDFGLELLYGNEQKGTIDDK